MAQTILGVQRERLAEDMLQFQQESIEASRAVIGIVCDTANQRIECNAARRGGVIDVVMLEQVACVAALVSDRSYPLVPQIVLGIKGVVVGILRRKIGREGDQRDTSACRGLSEAARQRQIVAAKC